MQLGGLNIRSPLAISYQEGSKDMEYDEGRAVVEKQAVSESHSIESHETNETISNLSIEVFFLSAEGFQKKFGWKEKIKELSY